MSLILPSSLLKAIDQRKKEDAFRSLSLKNYIVDFYSNDYLGRAQNPQQREYSQALLAREPQYNGSTGSRLLSGNYPLIEKAEELLAAFHQASKGLIFNSGYDANVGIFSSIPLKGDVVLYDQYIHASIRDGLQLTNAQSFKFKHNSLEDLREKLERFSGKYTTIYIATEAVFSMDGDIPNLKEMVALSKQYQAYLIVDEAHSVGVFGERGEGLCQQLGIADEVFLRLITFGKGIGAHGAIALAQEPVIDYLINFARSFIYTTAPSPESIASVMASYKLLPELKERKVLQERITFFREKIPFFPSTEQVYFMDSQSSIQGLIVKDTQRLRNLSSLLQTQGLGIKPIYAPTVPKGEERLRICLHSFNSQAEIEQLFSLITQWLESL